MRASARISEHDAQVSDTPATVTPESAPKSAEGPNPDTAPGLTVRPRSAPDLEVVLDPEDDLQVVHDDPPSDPPTSTITVDNKPARPNRYAGLFPGALAISLLLTSAVNAPGSADEPVRTRAEALAARTVQPAATLPLSGHPASTPVRLIGASEHGLAVWQGAATGSGALPTVYTGALTGPDGTMSLTARPGAGIGTREGSLVRLSVAGSMLAWYELGGGRSGNTYPQENRLDLGTGQDATVLGTGSLAVRERPRGGDATSPYTQIDPDGKLALPTKRGWTRFGDLKARVVAHNGRWVLEHGKIGSPAVRVVLPLGINWNSGLDAVGDRFYTASSGRHPAVYMIQGQRVTKVAEIPAARYPVTSWSLSAGSIHYTDLSFPPAQSASVFSSALQTRETEITLGSSTRLKQVAGLPVTFSAGRGVLRSPVAVTRWQFLDQGRTTAVVGQREVRLPDGGRTRVADDSPKISGAYSLVAGQVFRPDGELVWTVPAAAATSGEDDLYGADVIYSVPAGNADEEGHDLAGVWSVNVDRPLPIRLDTGSCEKAPLVAAWANRAAWTSCDGERITVQDLRTGEIRDIETGLGLIIGSDPQPISGLTLREGVLAWRDGEALSLVDLSEPGSSPVVLPGATTRFSLDGDLVARELRVEDDAEDTRLVLEKLPFEVNLRPRLIAAAAPLGFSPDGDGRYDRWSPQFDVTRPVKGAKLRILAPSGQVVRTFAIAGGRDGSLRGVVWDGRSDSGKPLAEGQYTWELSASAVDGSGTLTSAESLARSRGTIEISLDASRRPAR